MRLTRSSGPDGMFAPIRESRFRWLLLGRTATALADATATIALAFAILDLTGSVTNLGIVVAARSIASIVAALAGGVIADRLSRRTVLLTCSWVAAATSITMAALIVTESANTLVLAPLTSVIGLLSALTYPAASALVPETVPRPMSQRANAMIRLSLNSGAVLGASLGGGASALGGPGLGVAIAAGLYLLAPICFMLIRRTDARRPEPSRERSTPLADIRDGWRAFASYRWLVVVALCFVVYNAAEAGGVRVLGPAAAQHGIGKAGWGLVISAETIGMVLGAIVVMRVRIGRPLFLAGIGTLVSSSFLFALAFHAPLPVLAACALLEGAAIEVFVVTWQTAVQDHVADEHLARVYAIDDAIGVLAIPAGQLVAGPLSGRIGIQQAFFVAGLLMLGSVIVMLASRSVRNLRPAPEPEPAPQSAAQPVHAA